LVTAANTVVQNPESVGTTFKTLSARIRGATTELEELGEEGDEFTETTSKLQGLIKSLTGFDILESDQKTFKSIYDILIGIGKEWKNLDDIEQASLGEALAGKRNANTLYAVLDNIDTLEAAYQKAEESAGSAQREQENYQKGITYSINQAKAALEELAYDLASSDFLKGLVDTGTKGIELVDNLIDKFGTLKTVIVGIGTVWGSQKLGYCN
jgi:TP901 family phage tail tape measure protein